MQTTCHATQEDVQIRGRVKAKDLVRVHLENGKSDSEQDDGAFAEKDIKNSQECLLKYKGLVPLEDVFREHPLE